MPGGQGTCGKASEDGMFRLGARNHRVGLIIDHFCSPVDLLTMYNALCLWCTSSPLITVLSGDMR